MRNTFRIQTLFSYLSWQSSLAVEVTNALSSARAFLEQRISEKRVDIRAVLQEQVEQRQEEKQQPAV